MNVIETMMHPSFNRYCIKSYQRDEMDGNSLDFLVLSIYFSKWSFVSEKKRKSFDSDKSIDKKLKSTGKLEIQYDIYCV
ncbi:hypothetical protein V1478_017392 [Vespula squamosa]|uniref:Uncharacterized protein n=1 Tax=Vespula squamosa TaxID=30214 RepID=A0ABD1ZXU9_VESSQ